MYVTLSCVHAFCFALVAHTLWLSSQILVPIHWINNYIVYWTLMKKVRDHNVYFIFYFTAITCQLEAFERKNNDD